MVEIVNVSSVTNVGIFILVFYIYPTYSSTTVFLVRILHFTSVFLKNFNELFRFTYMTYNKSCININTGCREGS